MGGNLTFRRKLTNEKCKKIYQEDCPTQNSRVFETGSAFRLQGIRG